MDEYAKRKATIEPDGSPGFTTPEDTANEDALKARIGKAWNCELFRFGKLCAIDFYALRHNRLVALIEAKHRNHEMSTHDTVLLNVRKWLALTLGQQGLGVPAIFVASWTDGEARWLPINQVYTGDIRMGGTKQIVKSHSDIEPIIRIPLDSMKRLPGEPM